MTCPSPIAEILLNILRTGILRIRSAALAGNGDHVGSEVDHVHNLPALLKDYSPDALRFYWEIERASFISKVADVAAFEEMWRKLLPFAAPQNRPIGVP